MLLALRRLGLSTLSSAKFSKAKNLLVFAYVSFFLMWFITYGAFIVQLASSGAIFFERFKEQNLHCDFVCFYETGKIALSEDRTKPYDPAVQLKWINKLSPFPNDRPPYIQYVPFVFVMMAPLAMLPMPAAILCWNTFTLTCAIVGMTLLGRANKLSKKATAALIIVSLATGSAFVTLRTGQSSFLILGILCLFYWALLKRNQPATGIAAALTTLKIQYSPAAGLPLLATANWRAIFLAVCTVVAMLFLAGLNMGFENIINYPLHLLKLEEYGTSYGVKGLEMVSLRGVLEYTLGDKLAFKILLALSAVGAAFLLFLWKKHASAGIAHLRWLTALTIVWQLLFSLHGHFYDCVLLSVAPIMIPPLIDTDSLEEQPWQTNTSAKHFWSFLWLTFPIATWTQFFLLFMLPDPPRYLSWVVTVWLLMLMISAWTVRPQKRANSQVTNSPT